MHYRYYKIREVPYLEATINTKGGRVLLACYEFVARDEEGIAGEMKQAVMGVSNAADDRRMKLKRLGKYSRYGSKDGNDN
jgi:hypothetical protein